MITLRKLLALVALAAPIALVTGAFSILPPAAHAAAPRRVVSQTVLTDEVLLQIAAPAQIAALSHLARDARFCAVSAQARAFPQLPRDAAAEAVLRFRPDLVLLADFTQPELVAQLRRAGTEVWFFGKYDTLDDTYAGMRRLAQKLGGDAPARATAAINDCRQREAALAARLRGVKPVRVFSPSTYEIIPGDRTNFQDYCDHAGAENVAKTVGGLVGHCPAPTERMLGWPADKVVILGNGDTATLPTPTDTEQALRPLRALASTRRLAAIREGRAAVLLAWQINCVSHHRVTCHEFLARQLHPEVF